MIKKIEKMKILQIVLALIALLSTSQVLVRADMEIEVETEEDDYEEE